MAYHIKKISLTIFQKVIFIFLLASVFHSTLMQISIFLLVDIT